MNEKLKEIFDYYEKEKHLTQSELVISMLTEIQQTCGYISKEIQEKAALTAGVNPGYIQAVIKRLPHLHSQPYQYEITVCVSDRCKGKGSVDILKKLQKLLNVKPGEVSRDGRFLLTTQYCMHNCKAGPNLAVNGRLVEKFSVKDTEKLIRHPELFI